MSFEIVSSAFSVPPKKISNYDLAKTLDTSDDWIYSHTGIKSRYISDGQNAADIGAEAAQKALQKAGVDPQEVGLIVVATSTAPYTNFPSTACVIQNKLNIEKCAAYDVGAACTGFIVALLHTIQALEFSQNNARYALVIGTEIYSQITNWEDRSTAILFGDGAGALLLSKQASTISEQCILLSSFFESTASNYSCLTSGWNNNGDENNSKIFMNGREVYNFAVKYVPIVIKKLLENATLKLDDVDYIVAHQANARIIQSVAKRVNMPSEKFFINIDKYANTSAASIPIAIAEMHEKNMLQKKQKVMLVGFGAGLTYGGVLLQW